MVLVIGMGSVGISSVVFGLFMGSLVVILRWVGVDLGEEFFLLDYYLMLKFL